MLFKGWYMNNRLSPQIIMAHDVAAEATVDMHLASPGHLITTGCLTWV